MPHTEFLELNCPHCRQRLRIPRHQAGRMAICGTCQQQFTTAPPSDPPVADVATIAAVNPFQASNVDARLGAHQQSHRGGLILALSLLGWLLCPIFSVAAWVMGSNDLHLMQVGIMDASGEGLTRAGKIIAIFQCVLIIIGLFVWLVVIGISIFLAMVGAF